MARLSVTDLQAQIAALTNLVTPLVQAMANGQKTGNQANGQTTVQNKPALPEIKYVPGGNVPAGMLNGAIKGKPYVKIADWDVNRQVSKGVWAPAKDRAYIPTESYRKIAQEIVNFSIAEGFARIENIPADIMQKAGYALNKKAA